MSSDLKTSPDPGSSGLQVLLADDHQMFREGLRIMLEMDAGIESVSEAGTEEEILQVLSMGCPHIILLDIDLGKISGLDLIVSIREHCPEIKIILLTADKRIRTLEKALAKQINGYQLKDSSVQTLIAAMQKARSGQLVLPQEMDAGSQEAAGGGQKPEAHIACLTSKEREVYYLLLQGKTNREISRELMISLNTVKTHVSKIMKKMAVHKRMHLMRL